MRTDKLRVISRMVYPKWRDGEDEGGPGARPDDPAVLAMIVATARHLACQRDLEDANNDLEYDPIAYTSIDQLDGETVFHEATFRMLVAPENWEYVHHVIGDDAPRYHVIEIHESNTFGAVFAAGDTETVLLIIEDGMVAAEDPAQRPLEQPLHDALYG